MSRTARATIALAVLGLVGALAVRPACAQEAAHHAPAADAAADAAHDTAVASFVARARAGTARFHDRRAAIAAGYRRLGTDFPSMGEHWVNPGLVIRGAMEPERPAMLSYAVVRDTARLVGVIYAIPLAPGASPPEVPGAAGAWHEHNGTIDEESVAPLHGGHHHARPDASGTRLAILHAWTESPNPAGLFVSDNWALPFARLGLRAPASPDPWAARALSLASGHDAYWITLASGSRPAAPDAERELREALAEAREMVRPIAGRERGTPALEETEMVALREAWARVVARVGRSHGADAAARLAGER